MKCPHCGERLSVSHTVKAGPISQTQRRECPSCLKVVTTLTFIVYEDPERGQGARAVAKQVEEGEAIPRLEKSAPLPQA